MLRRITVKYTRALVHDNRWYRLNWFGLSCPWMTKTLVRAYSYSIADEINKGYELVYTYYKPP